MRWIISFVLLAGCASEAGEPDAPCAANAKCDRDDHVPLPKITFAIDPTFECIASQADPNAVASLQQRFGVEVVATKQELAVPGPTLKYLPDPANPADGLMQLPQVAYDEAARLVAEYAPEYDTSNRNARGTQLLQRVVDATRVPFPLEEKAIGLYLCPNIGAAYDMKAYPIAPYLSTVYPDVHARWSKRDWTDWYMLHEMLHWYLLDQPWLRVWTPSLQSLHTNFLATDPHYSDPPTIFPPQPADPSRCQDAYPELTFNMTNMLGHIHLNALRRVAFADEPEAWRYVQATEKRITADVYYGGSIDVVEALAPEHLQILINDVTHNAAPLDPKCRHGW